MAITILQTRLFWTRLLVALQQAAAFQPGGMNSPFNDCRC